MTRLIYFTVSLLLSSCRYVTTDQTATGSCSSAASNPWPTPRSPTPPPPRSPTRRLRGRSSPRPTSRPTTSTRPCTTSLSTTSSSTRTRPWPRRPTGSTRCTRVSTTSRSTTESRRTSSTCTTHARPLSPRAWTSSSGVSSAASTRTGAMTYRWWRHTAPRPTASVCTTRTRGCCPPPAWGCLRPQPTTCRYRRPLCLLFHTHRHTQLTLDPPPPSSTPCVLRLLLWFINTEIRSDIRYDRRTELRAATTTRPTAPLAYYWSTPTPPHVTPYTHSYMPIQTHTKNIEQKDSSRCLSASCVYCVTCYSSYMCL